MSTFCKYCVFWSESYKTHDRLMGICRNDQVVYAVEKDTDNSKYSEGILHTEQNFGCIHYRKEVINVTPIKTPEKKCPACGMMSPPTSETCKVCGFEFDQIRRP